MRLAEIFEILYFYLKHIFFNYNYFIIKTNKIKSITEHFPQNIML